MEGLIIIIYTLLGTLIGALLCLIPSLHIYNVTGIALLLWLHVRTIIPYYAMGSFFMAMMVSFAFINTIPMTFFAAADESAGATILPSLDMLKNGKGKDASLLAGLGTLVGGILLIVLTPAFYLLFTYVYAIMRPHLHWILGIIMVFYVMSEWPKGCGRGKTWWRKFLDGWRNVYMGMLTFTLSAIVGLIVLTKPLAPPEMSFQNIMPIFLGFFAFPSIIQAMLSDIKIPKQYTNYRYINAGWDDVAYSSLPGVIGGMICALMPAVTVGISAIFASHMTNHRNLRAASFEKPREPDTHIYLHTPEIYYTQERTFLIAGGINKIIYYVGAFLFIFILTEITPNGMGRGGMNIILKPVFAPEPGDYPVILASIFFSSCLCMLLLIWFTDLTIKVLPKINIKLTYSIVTVVLFIILYIMGGGWTAVLIAAVTTCIGSIPVFFNCRRSHCMAVLLVPIAINMAGYGDTIARFLRLV
ncbi:MAG: tripartite tricarboxylate transporter permease [Candidatus Hydrogenedentota bacterium]